MKYNNSGTDLTLPIIKPRYARQNKACFLGTAMSLGMLLLALIVLQAIAWIMIFREGR